MDFAQFVVKKAEWQCTAANFNFNQASSHFWIYVMSRIKFRFDWLCITVCKRAVFGINYNNYGN